MTFQTREDTAIQIKCIRCNVEGESTDDGDFVCPECGEVLAQHDGVGAFELRTYAGP